MPTPKEEKFVELIDLIKNNDLIIDVSPTKFHTLKCPCCNDTKKRAGFKFEKNKIVYHCFRGKCDISSTVFECDKAVPQKFKTVMADMGIPIPIELLAIKQRKYKDVDVSLYEKHSYTSLRIPADFIRYNPEKHIRYRKYLESRHIFDKDYYIGTEGSFRNKLISVFKQGKTVIFWMGVDIDRGFYLKASGNSDIVYSPNNRIPREPIIVEGLFDAKSIPNGVAVLQNIVSKKQAYILRYSSPILLPDRKHSRFLEVAKKYNWRICIPEWKEKDVNEAMKKYGRLVVARMIHDGIQKDLITAEVKYKMWKL